MLEEKKETVEIIDEKIKKVNGGVGYRLTRVDPGDVFINISDHNMGLVITNQVIFENTLPKVQGRSLSFQDGEWRVHSYISEHSVSSLESNYYFSAELTGTINYL